MKHTIQAGLGAVLVPVLATGALLTAPAAHADGVVKFGAALPLTGPLAAEGTAQEHGFKIWQDVVNKRGGIDVGGEKRKVEFVFYDYESKTPTATKLAERLITKDKIDILIGPFGSGATKAVAAIAERYKVPMIAPTASSEAVYDQGYKYLFGLLVPNGYLPEGFFTVVDNLNPKPKRIAFVTRNDFFPKAMTNLMRKSVKERGYEDIYYAEYPKDSKDMSTWLSIVKSKKPDILFVGGYVNDLVLGAKQARELGVNPPMIFMIAGPVYPQFVKALGPTSNHIVSAGWWAETFNYRGKVIGTAADFAAMWRSRYDDVADYVGAASAASGIVAQLAIEQAGSLDADEVIKAIAELKTETFFGPIDFNANGQNVGSKIAVVQIQNEQRMTVWPPSIADATLVYPKP